MNAPREQHRFVAEKKERTVKPPPRDFQELSPAGEPMAGPKGAEAGPTDSAAGSAAAENAATGAAAAKTAATGAAALPLTPPARESAAEKSTGTEQEPAEAWLLRAAPLEGGYLRLTLSRTADPARIPLKKNQTGGNEDAAGGTPALPASWALQQRPAEAAADAPAAGQMPAWSLTGGGRLHFGGLVLSGWQRHPEALRFSLELEVAAELYGLGERMGRLERSGRIWDMWNTDEPDHLPSRDPLYVNIPFALLHSGERWYGLLLDVPGRQYWNTAGSTAGRITVDVEEDYLDAYLFAAENPRAVLRRYSELTGRSPLPPRWALGFHQSRYSYIPAAQVEEIAERFRREQLPADVIHLDIDYMDGYRIFTWDRDRFPEPSKLARRLAAKGFRLVTIVDPGVKVDPEYHLYAEGKRQGYFCRRPGGRIYEGRVWPGPAVYPDFSRREVRHWWADHHRVLLNEGVAGIWNDMNEPADFTGDPDHRPDYTVPNEIVAENDGDPVSFRRFHNLYANAMNLAAREGFHRHRPGERGFLLTRSGYAGVQRSSAVWTGDNCSWWEHLAAAVPMLLGLGISGVPFVGSDTGGFQEDASPELYARWFAFSAFTPLFRAHTADDTGGHEPWSFGPKVLSIARHYLRLRYALLPYLYTAFEHSSSSGDPIMTPLFLEWPGEERLRRVGDVYLFGPALLAAPVTAPDQPVRHLYLPPGGWYDFWDDRFFPGGRDLLAPAPLERLPLFVRAGSVIPREEPRLSTTDSRQGPLTLEIYPDEHGRASGSLYEDAGEGFSHQQGAFLRLSFSFADGELSIRSDQRGLPFPWEGLRVRVHQPGSEEYGSFPAGREATALGEARLPAAFNAGGETVREFHQELD
jgi:alpha-glucosidase